MIPITKWAGLVTNASQYAIPPGAAVEQVNLQCLVPGQLTCRPGMAAVVFPNPSTTTQAIVRAFRYQHGSSEHIVYQDAAGNIYSSAVASSTAAALSPPGAPTITSALPGNATISVSVTAPTATGGSAVTGYAFEVSDDDGATWQAAGSSASTSYIILNLVNGTSYRVRASASNAVGRSDYSDTFGPVAPKAPSVGPSQPPSYVSATASGTNAAVVSWYTPTNNGGADITGYSIQKSSDSGLTWSAAATVGLVNQATVSGLSGGSDVLFRVAAITSFGTGQYSTASNAVSIVGSGSTPSQPLNLSGVATDTAVTLSWSAPSSAGSSSITGYTIRYGTSASGPWTTQSASGLSGSVTGLSANTSYTFGVFANNSSGAGQIATITVATLATGANTAPAAPTNLVLTATADGFSATWDAPASDGGSAITAYQLTTASSSSGAETQVYQNTTRSYTATGLTAGATVWVSVYAVNAVGTSAKTSASVRIGLVPSAPRNFTANTTFERVALSWAAPANLYGQQITHYEVRFRPDDYLVISGNALSATYTSTAASGFAGQAWAGNTFSVTIAAVTAAGTGATASLSFTAPLTPEAPPSAPRNYTLTPTSGGFIATWDEPSSLGTKPLLGYKTYLYRNASWVPLNDSTARTYEATGQTAGQLLSVKTVAYSLAGDSVAVTGQVTPYTLPTAPYNLTSSISYPSAGSGEVTLAWTRPTSFGGLALSQYVVFRDGAQVAVSPSDYITLTQTVGTASYVVYAETAAGRSPASTALSVTVESPAPPAVPTLSVASSSAGQFQFTATSSSEYAGNPVEYQGQFSLNNGATWQEATVHGVTLAGTVGRLLICDIPYAGSTPRAVLGRARASLTFSGTKYTSAWSPTISANVTFSAPLFAPTITSMELSGGKVRILWTAASSTGGSPITRYSVYYEETGGSGAFYDAGLNLQYDITRPSNNSATVRVYAYNAIGSTMSSAYTLPAVIPAPSLSNIIDGYGVGILANSDGTVKLRVNHPSGIQWQILDSYLWESSTNNATWTTLGTTSTYDEDQGRTFVATGQPSGLVYYRASASSGGQLSPPSAAKQKPHAPPFVRSLAMAAPSGFPRTTTVSWTKPVADGGRAITAYELQYASTTTTSQPAEGEWSSTIEHSVETYGAGPTYSRQLTFPILSAYYWVRVRAAVSRDFSDPIRASGWQAVRAP